MQVKELTLGDTPLKNNIFLAPMAGYTDYAFRFACENLNFGLRFTELVSAKGLFYGNDHSDVLLKTDNFNDTAAQIFGSDPFFMRKAIESEKLSEFKIIDINMGCPVPKVFKNGEGSALLSDIKKAEGVVKECVKSGKIITVKIRTGLKEGDDVAADFAKMAQDSGAKLITVHGRVRENYYSGEPNFAAIERAKRAVDIPVIANGGIFTVEDAENMINKTGADGVMIARGAISDPFIACRLCGKIPETDLKCFMLIQLKEMVKIYGEKRTALEFRKFVPYYFKGKAGFKDVKLALYSAETSAETEKILQQI